MATGCLSGCVRPVRGKEDVTQDGHRIEICSNIGGQEDIAVVKENDARGIGLFRTEFLYLRSARPPSEEEQFEVYRSVTAAMNGGRVIFRTLDIGADKQVPYMHLPKEENLGARCARHTAEPEPSGTSQHAAARIIQGIGIRKSRDHVSDDHFRLGSQRVQTSLPKCYGGASAGTHSV